MTEPLSNKPAVLITGSSGLIGTRLAETLKHEFAVFGVDLKPPWGESHYDWIECDMTDDQSVRQALQEVRQRTSGRLASVIHLAAYYDFSGEPSPLYQELTVEGTRRLLRGLRDVQVEQFVFSSTLLVQAPAGEGELLTAESPLRAEWDYPQSKVEAEEVIRQERGSIPAVILRIAGVYDDCCHSLPIAQQIKRIYEKQLESYVFPGDADRGQAFIHLDDLIACFRQVIANRGSLGDCKVFLVGEEDVMSYRDLQERIGELIHGRQWPAIRIPKAVAKVGAWVKEKMARDEEDKPFIKPWMVDLADQHYPVNVKAAREKLAWAPRRTLRETLPAMIEALHQDLPRFYKENKLPLPDDLKDDVHAKEPAR